MDQPDEIEIGEQVRVSIGVDWLPAVVVGINPQTVLVKVLPKGRASFTVKRKPSQVRLVEGEK